MTTDNASAWRNLIRFKDENGKEQYADALTTEVDSLLGTRVQTLQGSLENMSRTGTTAIVKELLSPVPPPPYILCVGLNYSDHAMEANLPIPPNPVTFAKPPGAITGPRSNIMVPPHATLLDYEGELSVVISRTGKNISEEEAPNYIAGFTAGNDVSSRYWQRQPHSGGQFSYAKSFDTFAPIGPTLLHPSHSLVDGKLLPLSITTRVNGEVRQKSNTDAMLFNVNRIIAHVSRGTTLMAGTIIMTGTPAGIAAKMEGAPWLKHGDVVEVEVEGVGSIRNQVVFESA